MSALDGRLGVLIERLQTDLREALPLEDWAKMVLLCAASELVCEDMQPDDRGSLRFAAARLVLETFDVSDSAIERAKEQLSTGREPESLNWRN